MNGMISFFMQLESTCDTQDESRETSFFDVNLQGTKNLCAALERRGVPRAFIFISTVAVYGCEYGEEITEEYPWVGNSVCHEQTSGRRVFA